MSPKKRPAEPRSLKSSACSPGAAIARSTAAASRAVIAASTSPGAATTPSRA
jgi:hypothetical protein